MRIVINGFGRIGKTFLRTILTDPEAKKKLDVVAINIGPLKKELIGHLFAYDTLMGAYPGTVSMHEDTLIIDNKKIPILAHAAPEACCWDTHDVDWVVDCSGKFTKRHQAMEHLASGAKAVLLSAPADGADSTIVPGVNMQSFDAKVHKIVSLGSCTTNALMPMLKILYDSCGLQQAWMTTVHAYTNSQVLIDIEDKDERCSRAAALNIIPTSTGAEKSIAKVMPELEGKVQVAAMRVPVAIVSLLEVVFESDKNLTREHINKAFADASQQSLRGIVSLSDKPLVSSDYCGNSHSVIIDGLMTQAMGKQGRVFGWYDNEWAYSMRMKEFLLAIA
jgi:glyceraldehyde 3-phosphate dehydrogenase